jgi:hypothetical protein
MAEVVLMSVSKSVLPVDQQPAEVLRDNMRRLVRDAQMVMRMPNAVVWSESKWSKEIKLALHQEGLMEEMRRQAQDLKMLPSENVLSYLNRFDLVWRRVEPIRPCSTL